ncbi:MAG: nitrogen fixation protein FixH [Pseudomonadota bacterium]|nr:nitrogen fixation protein FixH [Pseudomonadota bacterium]
MSSTTQSNTPLPHSGPWWKHGYMWLVVGGPLVVVVASFITLYLAISRPDPVYSKKQDPYTAIQQPANEVGKAELAPAMQARNHVATGGLAKPAEEPEPAPDAR